MNGFELVCNPTHIGIVAHEIARRTQEWGTAKAIARRLAKANLAMSGKVSGSASECAAVMAGYASVNAYCNACAECADEGCSDVQRLAELTQALHVRCGTKTSVMLALFNRHITQVAHDLTVG